MSKSANEVQQGRRVFLKGAAVTGVAAAVAAVLDGGPALPEAVAATPPAAPDRGYQESAHVRAYYRTARL